MPSNTKGAGLIPWGTKSPHAVQCGQKSKETNKANGFSKDVDWVEFRIYPENYEEEKLEKIAKRTLKKMNLRIEVMGMNKNKLLKKYAEDLFHLIDFCLLQCLIPLAYCPDL